MNPEEIERFRINLLQQLREAGGENTLPVSMLLTGVRLGGFRDASADTVRSGLAYLQDKGFVASPPKAVSPENKRWRITAAGIDFLAEEGV